MVDEASKSRCQSFCGMYSTERSERFLSFAVADDITAPGLADNICQSLANYKIPITNCVYQNYEGATVMSGHLRGVQALIKQLNPKALYFHCSSRRLNLVLVHSIKFVSGAARFFALLESLYLFMTNWVYSTTRRRKVALLIDSYLSNGKWAFRFDTVKGVLVNLEPI